MPWPPQLRCHACTSHFLCTFALFWPPQRQRRIQHILEAFRVIGICSVELCRTIGPYATARPPAAAARADSTMRPRSCSAPTGPLCTFVSRNSERGPCCRATARCRRGVQCERMGAGPPRRSSCAHRPRNQRAAAIHRACRCEGHREQATARRRRLRHFISLVYHRAACQARHCRS